jgi:hypothetical protein
MKSVTMFTLGIVAGVSYLLIMPDWAVRFIFAVARP